MFGTSGSGGRSPSSPPGAQRSGAASLRTHRRPGAASREAARWFRRCGEGGAGAGRSTSARAAVMLSCRRSPRIYCSAAMGQIGVSEFLAASCRRSKSEGRQHAQHASPEFEELRGGQASPAAALQLYGCIVHTRAAAPHPPQRLARRWPPCRPLRSCPAQGSLTRAMAQRAASSCASNPLPRPASAVRAAPAPAPAVEPQSSSPCAGPAAAQADCSQAGEVGVSVATGATNARCPGPQMCSRDPESLPQYLT